VSAVAARALESTWRVVTPEHVEVRLEPAGLGRRFAALTVDWILSTGFVLLLALVGGLLLPGALYDAFVTTTWLVTTWGYHVLFEVRRQGRTPGKRLCRLRVVDGRGLPITLQQSFVRNVARVVDYMPLFYGVGAVAAFCDPHRRRLGDVLAGTLVIAEARPPGWSERIAPSQRWNSLDAPDVRRRARARVGLEERELLLALCLRAERLEERARYDLMEEVAAHYRARLGLDDPHLSGENLVRNLTALLYRGHAGRGA